nr:MAG TPA: hypothetical protein [Caudoviricetes sp.]
MDAIVELMNPGGVGAAPTWATIIKQYYKYYGVKI